MSRGFRWSPADDAILLRLHAEGRPLAEMTAALNRSRGACRSRLFTLGISTEIPCVPCDNCGAPRRITNKLPLCARCMSLSSARRRCGCPRWLPRTEKCLHCEGNRVLMSRGLCRACYYDPAIRVLYPRVCKTNPSQGQAATMEVLACYPDHAERATCEHEKKDGECPQCEMEQRARLGIAGNQEAKEDAA